MRNKMNCRRHFRCRRARHGCSSSGSDSSEWQTKRRTNDGRRRRKNDDRFSPRQEPVPCQIIRKIAAQQREIVFRRAATTTTCSAAWAYNSSNYSVPPIFRSVRCARESYLFLHRAPVHSAHCTPLSSQSSLCALRAVGIAGIIVVVVVVHFVCVSCAVQTRPRPQTPPPPSPMMMQTLIKSLCVWCNLMIKNGVRVISTRFFRMASGCCAHAFPICTLLSLQWMAVAIVHVKRWQKTKGANGWPFGCPGRTCSQIFGFSSSRSINFLNFRFYQLQAYQWRCAKRGNTIKEMKRNGFVPSAHQHPSTEIGHQSPQVTILVVSDGSRPWLNTDNIVDSCICVHSNVWIKHTSFD